VTRDIDFAVAATEEEAERLVFSVRNAGYQMITLLEHRTTGRIATARFRQAPRYPYVNLLFAATGIEREIVAAADPLTVMGRTIPVATTGHLIAMKLVSCDDDLRPEDRHDLVKLSRIAEESDWSTARDAVQLITSRGFHRGRDLAADLLQLRSRTRRDVAQADPNE
jgi:hypothetical protein